MGADVYLQIMDHFFSWVMTGKTFLLVVDGVDISEDFFPSGRRIDHRLIERFGSSMVTDLACGIMDVDDFSYLFIVNGSDNSANPVENEDLLDIRVLTRYLQDVFHFPFILG